MPRSDENSKDPRRNVPVDLPGVEPEDYPQTVQNADKPRPDAGPPDYTFPGHPPTKETGTK